MRLSTPVHPAFFAIYPVLFLAGRNPSEVPLGRLALPGLVSLGCALALWGSLKLYSRTADNSAVLTSGLLGLFYSYGHTHQALLRGPAPELATPRLLLPVYGLLAIALVAYTMRETRPPLALNRFLNLTSIGLVLLALWPIAHYHFGVGRRLLDAESRQEAGLPSAREGTPSIYYVVLDGYANEATLEREYDYDNGPFVQALRERGFIVNPKSRSNYATTVQSLASSLNLDYFHELVPATENGESKELLEERAIRLLRNHELQRRLKAAGFTYIHFASSSARTGANPWADVNFELGRFDEFSLAVIRSTLLSPFDRWLHIFSTDRRDRILATFARLGTVGSRDGEPIFAFAHIISPHPPYVFGRDGERVPDVPPAFTGDALWHRKDLYLDQLTFINTKVLELVDQIRRAHGPEVVIVIQGDHGPASLDQWQDPSPRFLEERFGILNAIHVPADVREHIYPAITPVNTFRLILGHLLDQEIEFLPDRQLFSTYETRFSSRDAFVDVTDRFPD